MDRVIGIDLGTYNSCVAFVDEGNPQVIASPAGYRVMPSMVGITESGKRLIGHIAKRQAVTNAENTVYAAKRLIGRKWEHPQVQRIAATYPYRTLEGPNGDIRIGVRGKVYSVPEISAMILQEMRTIAGEYLSENVSKAVITVPAYFNDNQRQATRDAGAIAGLDVVRIINEPTAAALAYGFGKKIDRTVAVYDLGGGTFDISIMEISSEGVFKVVSTAGDTLLGGEDFDQRLLQWLVEGFKTQHDIDLRSDRMALQRLKDASEKAKCELSYLEETEVNLPFIISSRRNEALHLQAVISRQKLEELTEDLIERTLEITQGAIEEAGMSKDEIEDIILVGGMTRMVKVQRRVAEFFGREPCQGVNPDEVVALGAAIQGYTLFEQEADMVLLDVTPHTLGIMVAGGYFEELIPQNTTVPTFRSKIFTTIRDHQTAVKLMVLQGESERAAENEPLGEFILTGLRSAPAGQVEVEVTFEINADGIVSVHAKDLETGKSQSITVTASSSLAPDELDRMILEASQDAPVKRDDEAVRGLRQEAMSLIREMESLVKKAKGRANHTWNEDTLRRARAALERVQDALRVGDADRLGDELATLKRACTMIEASLEPSA